MMSRIGRNAEHLFESLCTAIDARHSAVVNRSGDDQHGWDHLVEINVSSNVDLPADLRNSLLRCFAQIKATEGSSRKVKIKLTNALKAAYTDLPFFVFLFEYKDGGSTPRVFARHIWHDDIEKCLKLARENQSLSDRELARKWVHISFGKDDVVSGSPADWIVERVLEIDGSYAAKKSEFRDNVGYGDERVVGNFVLQPDVSSKEIVEHQLGLSSFLGVQELKLFDRRFDIESTTPIREIQAGTLKITPHGKPMQLRASTQDGRELAVPGKIFLPGVVSVSDPEYAFKCEALGISLIAKPHEKQSTLQVRFDYGEEESLYDLSNYLQIISWMAVEQVTLVAEGENGQLFNGVLDKTEGVPDWLLQMATSADFIVKIIGEAEALKVFCTIVDLNKLNREIHLASNILSGEPILVESEFDVDLDRFKYICGYFHGCIGGISYCGIFKFSKCHLSKVDSRTRIHFRDLEIIQRKVSRIERGAMKDWVESRFRDFRASIDDKAAVFFNGDIAELTEAMEGNGGILINID